MSFHGPLPYQYRFPNQEFLYPALPQAETSLDPPSVSSLALNDLPPHQGHPVPVNPYYTQSRVRCIQPYMALDRPVPATPPAPRRRLSRATFAELAATQPLSWLHEVAQNRTRDEIADQINELVGSENELCEYQRRHPELPHLSEQLGMLEAAEAGNEMALFGAGSGSGSGSGPVVLAPIHEETKLPYPTPRIRIGDSAGEVVGDGDVPPPPWVLCSSYSDSEDGEEDIGFVGQLNRAGPAGDGYGSGIGSQYGSSEY